MIKLIMFDLDDTLVNHQAGAETALKTLAALLLQLRYAPDSYDFNPFLESYYAMNHRLWTDFTTGKMEITQLLDKRFDYIFDWFEVRQQHHELIKKAYWDTYVSSCSLTADWAPLLEEMSKKATLVICSNGLEQIQLRKLQFTHIARFFKGFYFGTAQPD
mgnify:CR=1 FL=1